MSRRFPHTVEGYEQMIADVARQEGFKVEQLDGTVYYTVAGYASSGEEVAVRVNVTRFAETMARYLS